MDNVHATFHFQAKQNGRKTTEEGRPIFDQVPYVQILMPGNDKTVIDRKVTDEDKERWPDKWQAFIQNEEAPETGTPIEQMIAEPERCVSQLFRRERHRSVLVPADEAFDLGELNADLHALESSRW